jgi:hypothetical protein
VPLTFFIVKEAVLSMIVIVKWSIVRKLNLEHSLIESKQTKTMGAKPKRFAHLFGNNLGWWKNGKK